MPGVHLGHNTRVADHVILANDVLLGGLRRKFATESLSAAEVSSVHTNGCGFASPGNPWIRCGVDLRIKKELAEHRGAPPVTSLLLIFA